MNDLTRYEAVRDQIRAGDIIAFQGSGILSGLISILSAGPSHIAPVRVIDRDAQGRRVVKLIESTIENGINGVQTSRLSEKLSVYPGRAWWLQDSEEFRADIDWYEYFKYIGESEGKVRYDTEGLPEFVLRGIPILGPRIGQTAHTDKMVCSAWTIELFEHAGPLRGINAAKTSPQDIVEMRIFSKYVQILGSPAPLRNFNSI